VAQARVADLLRRGLSAARFLHTVCAGQPVWFGSIESLKPKTDQEPLKDKKSKDVSDDDKKARLRPLRTEDFQRDPAYSSQSDKDARCAGHCD